MRTSTVLATAALLAPHVHQAWSSPTGKQPAAHEVHSISSGSSSHSSERNADWYHRVFEKADARVRAEQKMNLDHHLRVASYRGAITGNTFPPSSSNAGHYAGGAAGRDAIGAHWQFVNGQSKARIMANTLQALNGRVVSPHSVEALHELRRQTYFHKALLARQQQEVTSRPSPSKPTGPTAIHYREQLAHQSQGVVGKAAKPKMPHRPQPYRYPTNLRSAGQTPVSAPRMSVPSPVILESSVFKKYSTVQNTPVVEEATPEQTAALKSTARAGPQVGHARFRKAPAGQAQGDASTSHQPVNSHPQAEVEHLQGEEKDSLPAQASSSSSGSSGSPSDNSHSPRLLHLFE